MKKTAIASALILGLGVSAAQAVSMTGATFDMATPGGNFFAPDTAVTGSIGGGTWSVASTAPFFGVVWTAHDGTTYGPGTYDVLTTNGSGAVGPSGTVAGCTGNGSNAACYEGIVVGAGQVMGHILFDWGTSLDIDVVNVWNVSGAGVYSSQDVQLAHPASESLDGIPGLSMIDGPFGGYNANFNFTAAPAAIPVPAAVWLFGSGLLGLVGVARRKKQA